MNLKYCFFILLLTAFACKSDKTNQASTNEVTTSASNALPADFMPFYMRFHTDSIYQMAHITFPLEGFLPNIRLDSVAPQAHQWQQEEWTMHRPINNEEGGFRQEYQTLNNMVIEYIIHDDEKMAMERRFSKFGKDWYLIYYMGMNRVSYE